MQLFDNQWVMLTWRKDSPKREFGRHKVGLYSEESPTLLRSFSSEEHGIIGVLKLFTILLTLVHNYLRQEGEKVPSLLVISTTY